ncbi:MAG: hypothetical protein IK099_03800, partial [Clostridia bacterium]|nr:hypothetical protein [Clostridia bacterium]
VQCTVFSVGRAAAQGGRRGPKRLENLPLGWFSAKGGPEGLGQAAESCFLYPFPTAKKGFLASLGGRKPIFAGNGWIE